MPPRLYSRFSLSTVIPSNRDPDALILTERLPFRFRALPDNIQHPVVDGDTLTSLAARYFAPLPRPAGLFWVIADYQPEPIHDPTLAPEPGSVVVIPPLRIVTAEVFAESRRELP